MALHEIAVLIGPFCGACGGWPLGYRLLGDQAPALGQERR